MWQKYEDTLLNISNLTYILNTVYNRELWNPNLVMYRINLDICMMWIDI